MSKTLTQVQPASQTVTVLHVDDDESFRDLTDEVLQQERDTFDIVSVRSASRALELLAEEQVDCIVSDYDMPRMDGIEFLEAVRDRYPTLPFVLFTGKGSEKVASDAFSAGATDYVQKSGGTGVYTVLAKSIENAVEKERTRQQHQRHLKAIENAEEGIAILGEDADFVFVNDRYVELFGYDRSELLGEPWDVVHPDNDRGVLAETVRTTAREQGTWHGQTTGLCADGSTFPCETSVTATETGDLICVARDLSERQRRERELSRYQTIIDTVADPVYILDMEGRFSFVNEAMVEKLGCSREALLEEHASIALTEESLERANEAIADLLQDDERDTVTVELEKTPVEGPAFIGENHITLLTTPDGEAAGTAGVVRDITDRKQREEELARQRSLLEAQNERLDEFASVVSHDLRNPLNVATNSLQLEQKERSSDHLERADRALDRMEALIDDLLTLARESGELGDLQPVDLAVIAEDCWTNVETGEATLVTDVDRMIDADEGRLKQVIENLVRNAIEHGGRHVTVTLGELGDGFYIEDDGPGIPADEHADVFTAGYSTSDAGTGFGLSIVKQVVEAHDWDIHVTDGADGGARFEITGIEFVSE